MGGLTFTNNDHREVRQAVVAIDANLAPKRGDALRMAIWFGWVHVDRSDDGREDFILTAEGQALARQWRDDDSHGGNAA